MEQCGTHNPKMAIGTNLIGVTGHTILAVNTTMAGRSWTFSLTLLLLACLWWSCEAYKLGERAFPQLTAGSMSTLVSITDPIKNIDPHNPSSHLSEILIPRVCKSLRH